MNYAVISSDQELQEYYDRFIDGSLPSFEVLLEPYNGRITKGLYRRHLLPSFINKQKTLALLGYIQCESHLPKVLKSLNRKSK